jgi:hypothetical protein
MIHHTICIGKVIVAPAEKAWSVQERERKNVGSTTKLWVRWMGEPLGSRAFEMLSFTAISRVCTIERALVLER